MSIDTCVNPLKILRVQANVNLMRKEVKKNIPILFLWNDTLSILKHRECEHKWKWSNYKIAFLKKRYVKKYKLQNQLSVIFPISPILTTTHAVTNARSLAIIHDPFLSLSIIKIKPQTFFFLKYLKSMHTTTALLHLLLRLLLLWYLSMVSILAVFFFFKYIIKKSCQNDLLKRKCWHQQLSLNISIAPHLWAVIFKVGYVHPRDIEDNSFSCWKIKIQLLFILTYKQEIKLY